MAGKSRATSSLQYSRSDRGRDEEQAGENVAGAWFQIECSLNLCFDIQECSCYMATRRKDGFNLRWFLGCGELVRHGVGFDIFGTRAIRKYDVKA